MQIGGSESGEGGELLNHRRDDEVDDAREYGYDGKHRNDDAYSPHLDMEPFLDEDNDGIHEVCQYPCDEEWQEYCAQVVEHEERQDDDSANDYPADESVEGDFLF